MMTHTAVGLFKNSSLAEEALKDLEIAGVAAQDLRILAEPRRMPVSGVLSTPDNDFCAALRRNLRTMGTTDAEAQAYIEGVRRGAVLVFANGSAEQVEGSAEIMNRHQASSVNELTGSEAILSGGGRESAISAHGDFAQAGRARYSGSGARIFVW
jgi:hypothetical protein